MKKQFLQASLISSAILLAACDGSDVGSINGGSSTSNSNAAETLTTTPPASSTPQPAVHAACRPDGRFTYSGSASQVAANNGQLAVVVVPTLPNAYAKNRNMTASAVPASSLVQQSGGGFTTLASSAAATDCLGLEHGAVTEIQSVGSDVAIGRWNKAMDTDGNTYNDQQGVHYAVGTPLSLSATSGTLVCTQLIADTVGSDDGTAGGMLETSSATLDLATRTLNNLNLSINWANTPYALTNTQRTLTNTEAPLNGVSKTERLTVQSVVVGRDATQPMVAVGYSTGSYGGVVVLSCH
jgi:hypothetical protein